MSNAESQDDRTSLQSSIDRLRNDFEKFVEGAVTRGARAWEAFGNADSGEVRTPKIDILETNSEIEILVSLPGAGVEDINVVLEGSIVTIQAQLPDSPAGRTAHLRERLTGRVARSIPLPCPVQPGVPDAILSNGVLKVSLEKSVTTTTTRVPIRSESPDTSSNDEVDAPVPVESSAE